MKSVLQSRPLQQRMLHIVHEGGGCSHSNLILSLMSEDVTRYFREDRFTLAGEKPFAATADDPICKAYRIEYARLARAIQLLAGAALASDRHRGLSAVPLCVR